MVIVVTVFVLIALVFVVGQRFEPGEEIDDPGIKDIAVSEEDTLYPPSDVLRFAGRPAVIYIYVAVEDLPTGTELSARVDRSGRDSVISRLMFGRSSIEAVDEEEEQLNPSGEGVSGVVKFAIRMKSGAPLPAGGYLVSIQDIAGDVDEGETMATKRFVVSD